MKYDNMPDLLTVEVAGKLIGIGRCAAYEMTCEYEANPETGIPIVNIGRKKFVPKWELLKRFRMVPDEQLVKMLIKEVGKEELIKIIEREG